MTLAQINRKIRLKAPNVELVRGEGYHYYIYDDGKNHESFSVMVMYTSHIAAETWIADGIEFSEKTEMEIRDREEYSRGFRGGATTVSMCERREPVSIFDGRVLSVGTTGGKKFLCPCLNSKCGTA